MQNKIKSHIPKEKGKNIFKNGRPIPSYTQERAYTCIPF